MSMKAVKTGKAGRLLLCVLTTLMLTGMFSFGAGAAANIKKKEVLKGGTWETVNGKVKYRKANGTYAAYGFKVIGGKWYYLSKAGNVVTGFKKLGGKRFYFQTSGEPGVYGRMKTGLVEIKGKKYFFSKTGGVGVKGSMVTSEWKTVGGEERYFTVNGTMSDEPMLTETEFIQKIGPLAKKDMKRSGILASVTIAQAILESYYGRSSLGMEANNLFGMKATLSGNDWKSSWDGKTFKKKTKEYVNGRYITITAEFRAYDTIEQSIKDHSDYLTGAKKSKNVLRYQGVVGNKSYKSTIQIIKNGGYATAPNYVSSVVSIIKRYKLTKYDK